MKILIYLHELVLGGTTVNSIELAAALRDLHGHDVVLFATPGPMTKLVEDYELRFLPAPVASGQPSLARMRALREAVRCERPDLLYVWETLPCVDAYYAVHLPMGIPMLVTDMQMYVTRLLPKKLITTFGTPDLVEKARAAGRRKVELLLPPVDIRKNAPGVLDPAGFRRRWGIRAGDITLVTVSRLIGSMKGESLIRTINAVRTLGRHMPLRLLIVGDGSARAQIGQLADEVNTQLGRSVVVLTGAMHDPRPAYAAADIVVGMGGSALRGMAFGKPLIVVGERAFSAPFTPATAEHFYFHGFYGMGDGRPDHLQLTTDIQALAERPNELQALGEFSRQFVVRHFALDVVASRLAGICNDALADTPRFPGLALDAFRTTAVYMRERRFRWRVFPSAPMACTDLSTDDRAAMPQHIIPHTSNQT